MLKSFRLVLVFTFVTASAFSQVIPRKEPQSAEPAKTPQPVRVSPARNPPKDLLQQKWPAPQGVVELPSVIDVKTADVKAKFEKAKALIAERKLEVALPILLDAEKAAPERFEIQLLLGSCLAQLGRLDEAARAFQKAVNLDPKSAIAHIALCRALADTSKPVEAIGECRESVRLAPRQAVYKQTLASIYLSSEAYSEAIQLLEADAATQNELVSTGLLGDSYFLSGEYIRAAETYEKIASAWPQASLVQYRLSQVYDYLDRSTDSIASARKFVELEPKLFYSHLNLGEKLQQAGFFDESIEALKRALVLEPNSGIAAFRLSENYSILGDQDNALINLRIAYQHLPHTTAMAYKLGTALIDNGSDIEAVEPLEFANKSEPNQPDIMRSLGLAYIKKRLYDEGIDLVERANQLSPLPSNVKMDFSALKNRTRDLARFDETLDFIQKHPTNLDARSFLIHLYLLKDQAAEAEKQSLELIKLCPDSFEAYNDLAVFYEENKQPEKAIEAFRKSIQLKPHHVVYMSLSWQLSKLGRLDEAIEAAAHAVELKPESLEVHLAYGELLLKKGRRSDALREFQAGFQIASGDVRPNFRLTWLYIQMGDKQGAFRHYAILK